MRSAKGAKVISFAWRIYHLSYRSTWGERRGCQVITASLNLQKENERLRAVILTPGDKEGRANRDAARSRVENTLREDIREKKIREIHSADTITKHINVPPQMRTKAEKKQPAKARTEAKQIPETVNRMFWRHAIHTLGPPSAPGREWVPIFVDLQSPQPVACHVCGMTTTSCPHVNMLTR